MIHLVYVMVLLQVEQQVVQQVVLQVVLQVVVLQTVKAVNKIGLIMVLNVAILLGQTLELTVLL